MRRDAGTLSLFDAPVVDMTQPPADVPPATASAFDAMVEASTLPIAGKTTRSRHASATGAVAAAQTRRQIRDAYLDLFVDGDRVVALSDHEAVDELKRRFQITTSLSSINSTRNNLGAAIVDSGTYEAHRFGDGRETKRTRWIPRDKIDAFTQANGRKAAQS